MLLLRVGLQFAVAFAASFVPRKTASVVRGVNKEENGCSFSYCHKSCGMGLEGKDTNNPFAVEWGVLGLGIVFVVMGRAKSGTLSNLARCNGAL